MTLLTLARPPRPPDERSFLLQRAQPAMTGLIDGVLHTLPFLIPAYGVALVVALAQSPSNW